MENRRKHSLNGKQNKKVEELLKMIREREQEDPDLYQVNNLEQAEELKEILENSKRIQKEIEEHQKESEQVIGALLNYPMGTVVGCAIMYGIDIHHQYGYIDGKELIRNNKVGSLKGVLQKIENIDEDLEKDDEVKR
mgnify:CR=1 FL=1